MKDVLCVKFVVFVVLCLIVVVEVAVFATVYFSRERWGVVFMFDYDVCVFVLKLMVLFVFYVFFDVVCCVSMSVL